VIDPDMGTVVGTLDVESAERDAFTDAETRRRSGAPPRSPA
jgi:putative methionine-R-sulfoxide reductase with GAF domain